MKIRLFISMFLLLAVTCVGMLNLIPDTDATSDTDKPVLIKRYSSTISLNEEELFGYADLVAQGKVKEVSEPKLVKTQPGTEDESFLIYKDYVFVIDEAFKGCKPTDEVTIRVPGGQVGKKEFITDGTAPELNKKQILFLKQYQHEGAPDVAYVILCDSIGKYTIDNDEVRSFDKAHTTSSFKEKLSNLKEKHGDKIILPPGFIQ